MRFCLLLASVVIAAGCTSRTETTATTDSSVVAATQATSAVGAGGEQCYQQLAGRDTTTLRLTVNGSDVTGELAVLPFEKDRAQGPIRGTLNNGAVTALWQRSGEGTTQPYEVNLVVKGDSVLWRDGERVQKAGTWVLKSPNDAYQYVLMKSNCQ